MILYGLPVVETIENELKEKVKSLAEKNIRPFLAVILLGSDPASVLYTRKKQEKAESLGIGFRLYRFPAYIAEEDITEVITDLNHNKNVHGVMIQLPLPKDFDTPKVLSIIAKEKDVDGLNNGFAPTTAGAILELLNFYKISLEDKKIVLVGRGKLVGQPLEKILSDRKLDFEICDSKTENLAEKTLNADLIISGVGKPGLIKSDMLSAKTIVIDAGTAESSGTTVGDLDPTSYEKIASYSPVPGGLGPITVMKLLKNVVEAAERSI